MAEGTVMKTSNRTDSRAAIGLMNLDKLNDAQIGVADFLERAYVSLVDYPGLFTKVHLSASNAQTIHMDTTLLIQTFATTLNHLIESMIPMAVRGIQQKNIDLQTKVFNVVMEKADSMNTATKSIADRYLELRDDIRAKITEVEMENNNQKKRYETCLKEREQNIQSAGKAEDELRQLERQDEEIQTYILLQEEKMKKLESCNAGMADVVCTTHGARKDQHPWNPKSWYCHFCCQGDNRNHEIMELSDNLHQARSQRIELQIGLRKKRLEVIKIKSQVEKSIPQEVTPADPKCLENVNDLLNKIPLYLNDIATFWKVLKDEIRSIKKSISLESPDKVEKMETLFRDYKTEHLELTRRFSEYLHNVNICDLYKFLFMSFNTMTKMSAMYNAGELQLQIQD